jgi:hypothetical protein
MRGKGAPRAGLNASAHHPGGSEGCSARVDVSVPVFLTYLKGKYEFVHGSYVAYMAK